MTKVLIEIPPELNKKIDVKRAQEGEKKKEVIINRILEEYFQRNEIPIR